MLCRCFLTSFKKDEVEGGPSSDNVLPRVFCFRYFSTYSRKWFFSFLLCNPILKKHDLPSIE